MRVFSFKAALTEKKLKDILDEIMDIQKGNEVLRNQFIEKYSNYIVSMASRVKGNYVQIENDEEYSVALNAFNRAVDLYNPDRGASFFTFAGLLIKRDIIDLYKKNSSLKEIPISHLNNEDNDRSEYDPRNTEDTIRCQEDQFNLQQEINIYKTLLKEYAIDFNTLASVSPKHAEVRRKMIMLAKMLSEEMDLKASIIKKKTLPLKEMESRLDYSRKTLERHRKYILANFILINSDLDYLKEYIKDVLQGGENC